MGFSVGNFVDVSGHSNYSARAWRNLALVYEGSSPNLNPFRPELSTSTPLIRKSACTPENQNSSESSR
jgi:hypothetical protein